MLAEYVARLACGRRHPHFGNTIALAQALMSAAAAVLAALRPPVGRDRRSGGARRAGEDVPASLDRPRLCLYGSRCRLSVDDGREGFPASLIGQNREGVEMKVVDGSLRIRSLRTARAYVGVAVRRC